MEAKHSCETSIIYIKIHRHISLLFFLFYSCYSHLEHRPPVKHFVSLHFLNLRQSVGLLGREISPSQGRYITQTDIHALSGTRTHDPSVRAGEDISCFRPRNYCDRPATSQEILIVVITGVRTSNLEQYGLCVGVTYRRKKLWPVAGTDSLSKTTKTSCKQGSVVPDLDRESSEHECRSNQSFQNFIPSIFSREAI
jgi:hypothetical protein